MTSQSRSRTSRRGQKAGYLISVIVNVIAWVIVNSRPGWRELPFLTEDFVEILWLVNLSIVTSAVVNAVYLSYDRAWFKSVSQIGVLAVGLTATVRTWQVFPFDFSGYSFPWTGLARLMLILGIFGSAVAIVVELVKLTKLASGQTTAGAGTRSVHHQ